MDTPARCRELPAWLAITYVGANTVLSVLNFYWFYKMVAAVRKRFPNDNKDTKAIKRSKDTTDEFPEKED